MAAVKRPVDSGAKDALGRAIKVSQQTVDGRASAPPPPSQILPAGDKDDESAGDAVPERSERELAAEELSAAQAALAAARSAVFEAEKALRAAQRREALSRVDELSDQVKGFADGLEVAFNTFQNSRTAMSLLSVEDHAPRLAAAEAARKMVREIPYQTINAYMDAIRDPDDWNKRDPLYERYSKLSEKIEEAAQAEWAIGAFLKMGDRVPGVAAAIAQVDRYGVGDWSGLPCTNCGGRRTRYNDETYECGSC